MPRPSVTTAEPAIVTVVNHHRALAGDLGANGIQLLDYLFAQPLVNVNAVGTALRVSWPTANKLAHAFAERGILDEATGFRRNRVSAIARTSRCSGTRRRPQTRKRLLRRRRQNSSRVPERALRCGITPRMRRPPREPIYQPPSVAKHVRSER
jgi:hypothetical protein